MEDAVDANHCRRTQAKVHLWGEDTSATFEETFDVCLLCEVLYWPGLGVLEEDTIAALATSVASLTHVGSLCICIFKERAQAREHRFLRLCEANGFEVQERTEQWEIPDDLRDTDEQLGVDAIRCYELRRVEKL